MSKETSKDARAIEPVEGKAAEEAGNLAEAMKKPVPGKEQKAVKDAVYSSIELAASAGKLFGTRQECVLSALRAAGKRECTVSEAKNIVKRFLDREVK